MPRIRLLFAKNKTTCFAVRGQLPHEHRGVATPGTALLRKKPAWVTYSNEVMLILTLPSSFLQVANPTFSNLDHTLEVAHEGFSRLCHNSQDQRIQMALKGTPKSRSLRNVR